MYKVKILLISYCIVSVTTKYGLFLTSYKIYTCITIEKSSLSSHELMCSLRQVGLALILLESIKGNLQNNGLQ